MTYVMGFSVKYLRLFSCTAASPFLSVKYKQKDYTLLFVLRNRKMYSPCDASDHIAAAGKSQGGLHLLLLRDFGRMKISFQGGFDYAPKDSMDFARHFTFVLRYSYIFHLPYVFHSAGRWPR